jgi:cell division inhibitor SepF
MANPLKKSLVFLGLADEEDYDVDYAPAAASHQTGAQPRGAQVTPMRAARAPKGAPVASAMNEIVTVHPKAYVDARIIAENFREGIPVIMNLSQMNEHDAKRLIDFASGLTQGLFGSIDRVTSQVFLLSPENVAVSGDDPANTGEVDRTFVN